MKIFIEIVALVSFISVIVDATDNNIRDEAALVSFLPNSNPISSRSIKDEQPSSNAIDHIKKRQLLSDQDLSSVIESKILNRPLVRGAFVGRVDVAQSFSLSFIINPTDIQDSGNILHFTSNDADTGPFSSRCPGIWMNGKTTSLQIVLGTTASASWNVITSPLIPNRDTNVTIYAVDSYVLVYFDDKIVVSAMAPGSRYSGTAFMYASDLWRRAANATLKGFSLRSSSLEELQALRPLDQALLASVLNRPIARNTALGIINVPLDFALSFSITLPEKVDSGNIIHVTADGKSQGTFGCKSPTVTLEGATRSLLIIIRTITTQEISIRTPPLPINTFTNVTIYAIDDFISVFYDNALVSAVYSPLERYEGPAMLYVSGPFIAASSGSLNLFSIKSFTLTDLANERSVDASITTSVLNRALVSGKTVGIVSVPRNFALSFKINPFDIVEPISNICHFKEARIVVGFRGNSTLMRFVIPTYLDPNFQIGTPALPLNQDTSVSVYYIGENIIIYYDDKIVASVVASNPRYTGPSFLHVSSPDTIATAATIKEFSFKSYSASEFQNERLAKQLGTASVLNRPLMRDTSVGTINVPENFALSFTIRVLSVPGSWENILHLTSNGQNSGFLGARCPAVWLNGRDTLVTVIGNTADINWQIVTPSLPLNMDVNITIYAIDKTIIVYYNNTIVHSSFNPNQRYTGPAIFYVSDPFHKPANATLKDISLKPYTVTELNSERSEADAIAYFTTSMSKLAKLYDEYFTDSQLEEALLNRPLVRNTNFGRVNVPQDLVLSFTINPRATVDTLANIIHLTSNGENAGSLGSRSPAIWFAAKSTSLFIVLGTTMDPDWSINTPSLDLNRDTKVTLYAVGKYIFVLYDDNIVFSTYNAGLRYEGSAILFLSDPFYNTANATLKAFSFKPSSVEEFSKLYSLDQVLAQSVYNRPLVKGATAGIANIPKNFELSLAITPQRASDTWTSILLLLYDKSAVLSGSRYLKVLMPPGGTNLSIVVGSIRNPNWNIRTPSLDINKTTEVTIYEVDNYVLVYFADKLVVSAFNSDEHFEGSALVYTSAPDLEASVAMLTKVSLRPYSIETLQIERTLSMLMSQTALDLPLVKGRPLSVVNIPRDFSLFFTIRLTASGNPLSWTNVLHILSNPDDNYSFGSRSPAIFVSPGTTALQIRFGNSFFQTPSLPLQKDVNVSLYAIDKYIWAYFDDLIVATLIKTDKRYEGPAILYASDLFSDSAPGSLKSLSLNSLTMEDFLSEKPAASQVLAQVLNRPLSPRPALGLVNVPQNFSLSFTINPASVSGSLSNILRFTSTNQALGALGDHCPSLWFIPQSTAIQMTIGSTGDVRWSLQTPSLPLNTDTTVSVYAVGERVFVYFGAKLVLSGRNPGLRLEGSAMLLAPDSRYSVASATLKSFTFKASSIEDLKQERPDILL